MLMQSTNQRHNKRFELEAGPDLPMGYVGLSLGPQDPRSPPANCDTYLVSCR